MAVEVSCPGCSRRLSLPQTAPDQQIKCPSCGRVFTQAEINPFSPLPSGAGFPQPPIPPPAATEMWYVQTPDGQQFGPVSKWELDQWAMQGRLRADFELMRAGGTSIVRKAVQFYPALASGPNSSYPTTSYGSPSSASRPGEQINNPYASPNSPNFMPQSGPYLAAHRGGLILALGLLSFVLCLFCLIAGLASGIAAWVMGVSDLKQMRNGRMDPSGEGLTRAGMILGIIMCVLVAVGFVCVVVIIALNPPR